MELRADLALISDWIKPKAHVLDLGCGDGRLLAHLRDSRQVTGYGLEISDDNILNCINAGVNVIHFDLNDLNKGLCDFNEDSFDYVIMTQALQTVRYPDFLLMEMLRVGQEGIVTFPNFGHWSCRLSIGIQGRMPISPSLPNEWFDTENIHLCTIRDFEQLCDSLGIEILQRSVVDPDHNTRPLMRLMPNLFGEIALYRFRRRNARKSRNNH